MTTLNAGYVIDYPAPPAIGTRLRLGAKKPRWWQLVGTTPCTTRDGRKSTLLWWLSLPRPGRDATIGGVSGLRGKGIMTVVHWHRDQGKIPPDVLRLYRERGVRI